MTLETFNKIKQFIEPIEMCAVHTNEYGHCRGIIRDLELIRKEFKPDAPPVDMSCSACILEMIKDIYRHYKQAENDSEKNK